MAFVSNNVKEKKFLGGKWLTWMMEGSDDEERDRERERLLSGNYVILCKK